MSEKLSERIADELSHWPKTSSLVRVLSEAYALAKRVEDAPVAPVLHTWAGGDRSGQQWFVRETMLSADCAGKRVRLVVEGE